MWVLCDIIKLFSILSNSFSTFCYLIWYLSPLKEQSPRFFLYLKPYSNSQLSLCSFTQWDQHSLMRTGLYWKHVGTRFFATITFIQWPSLQEYCSSISSGLYPVGSSITAWLSSNVSLKYKHFIHDFDLYPKSY